MLRPAERGRAGVLKTRSQSSDIASLTLSDSAGSQKSMDLGTLVSCLDGVGLGSDEDLTCTRESRATQPGS